MNFPIYHFESVKTGSAYSDSEWILHPTGEKEPSLLRSVYATKQVQMNHQASGLFQYSNWLPVRRFLTGSASPVTYKSEKLARFLRLENLYITFSGYWPERSAYMQSCTFKETEAYTVCGRIPSGSNKTLVVASAGNTARAFAKVCSENDIPLVVFVPERNFSSLWFDTPLAECVTLVSVQDSDYLDAIRLSEKICNGTDYLPEGGVKNTARRDGMGTCILSATLHIGQIPEYYFQAIGSGSGTIAAWETNLRLLRDGRFGRRKMKLLWYRTSPLPLFFTAGN